MKVVAVAHLFPVIALLAAAVPLTRTLHKKKQPLYILETFHSPIFNDALTSTQQLARNGKSFEQTAIAFSFLV